MTKGKSKAYMPVDSAYADLSSKKDVQQTSTINTKI